MKRTPSTSSGRVRHGARAARCTLVAVAVTASLGTGGTASAYEPVRTLGQVQGLSELQQRTGDAVQAVCGGFLAENEADPEAAANRSAASVVLFDKCGEMVHTANRLAGNGGPTIKDLGTGAEQLGAALQNVAPEEIAAAGSLATETASRQGGVVGRRLASVLSQSSTLQVSAAGLLGAPVVAVAGVPGLSAGGAAAADDEGGIASRLGVYASVVGSFAEKRETDAEDAFDADTAGISIGVDYLVGSSFVAGVNAGFTGTTTDFDIRQDVAGGSMDSGQFSASLYGMYFNDVAYVDAVIGGGVGTFDLERRVVIQAADGAASPDGAQQNDGLDETVSGDSDSATFRFGLGAGMEVSAGAVTFAPFTRLSYQAIALDGYAESGGTGLELDVEGQDIDSFTGSVGFRLVGTYSGDRAVVSPQFNVEMIREFMDDSRQIVSSYVHDPRSVPFTIVTDDPDRTYYSVGFGLSAVFPNGFQAFGEVRSLLDLDDLDEISAIGGVRFEF